MCSQKQIMVQVLESKPALCTIIEICNAEGTQPSIASTKPVTFRRSTIQRTSKVSVGKTSSLTQQIAVTALHSCTGGIGHKEAPKLKRSIACDAFAMFPQASCRQANGPTNTKV